MTERRAIVARLFRRGYSHITASSAAEIYLETLEAISLPAEKIDAMGRKALIDQLCRRLDKASASAQADVFFSVWRELEY